MEEQLLNFVESLLDGAINNSQTTLDVTPGDGALFGASGNLTLVVEDEIVVMTSIATDTLTIARAQEGTTAVSHASGTKVSANWTKGTAENIMADYNRIDSIANRPSPGRKGQRFKPDDAPFEYVHDGTNWRTQMGQVIAPFGPIDTGSGTLVNFSGATATDQGDTALITIPNNGGNFRFVKWPLATPGTYTVEVTMDVRGGCARATVYSFLGLEDSATGKFFTLGLLETDTNQQLWFQYNNSPTSAGGVIYNPYMSAAGPLVLRLSEASSMLTVSYSPDGINFYTLGTVNIGTYFGGYASGDIDNVLVGGYNNGADIDKWINFGGLTGR